MLLVFARALALFALLGFRGPSLFIGFRGLGRTNRRGGSHLTLARARVLHGIFELVGRILLFTFLVYLFNEIIPGRHYNINKYKKIVTLKINEFPKKMKLSLSIFSLVI